MKLRPPFSIQQLLFTAGCAFLSGAAAFAQDIVITTDNQQRQVKVTGVSPSGQLEFLVGQGKLGMALSSIKEVRMAPPPEYGQAFQAYQVKDFKKALDLMKPIADHFRGMPSPWAQQAVFDARRSLYRAERLA